MSRKGKIVDYTESEPYTNKIKEGLIKWETLLQKQETEKSC